MEVTDKVYLKKQYIDPRGNLVIPGEYLYGELNTLIRDNSEYVCNVEDIVIVETPLHPSSDITNITARPLDEKIQAELFNVEYANKAVFHPADIDVNTVADVTVATEDVKPANKITKTNEAKESKTTKALPKLQ